MVNQVTIEVRGESTPGYGLAIRLKNQTGQPLTLYRYGLPWVGRYSMIIIAVKTDAPGTVLDATYPIDDPGAGTITIQPGETLTGWISLVERFPGFEAALDERDLIVFWSYQFQSLDAVSFPRVGGWVLFDRMR